MTGKISFRKRFEIPLTRTLILAAALSLNGVLVFTGSLAAAWPGEYQDEVLSLASEKTEEGKGSVPAGEVVEPAPPPTPAVDVEPSDSSKIESEEPRAPLKMAGYASLDLSVINFEARGPSKAEATGYGLVMVGGYRFGEFFSVEGAVNWLPLADSSFLLPIPMVWLPAEDGLYLNLAGGMRLNLVGYSSHSTVPWLSIWYTGHAVLSDFSVAGSGLTYGAGLEWEKKNGKRVRLALRLHNFDGDLEVHRKDFSTEYGPTDIQAVELNLTVFGDQ